MKKEEERCKEKRENIICIYYDWNEIEDTIKILTDKIKRSQKKYDTIIGISRGGIIPARLISRETNINHIQFIQMNQKKIVINELPVFQSNHKYLIVDDIYDSGDTYRQITAFLDNKIDFEFASLYIRYNKNNRNRNFITGKILNHDKWIVFPWEKDDERTGK